MRFSRPQSRLAASLAASLPIFALYVVLFSPRLALAAETGAGPRAPEPVFERGADGTDPGGVPLSYRSDFSPVHPGLTGSLSLQLPHSLSNNIPLRLSLDPGASEHFVFKASARKRDLANQDPRPPPAGQDQQGTGRPVFLSANVCLHPEPEHAGHLSVSPPQLQMHIAPVRAAAAPGPMQEEEDASMTIREFEEGAVVHALETSDDIYFSIMAPVTGPELAGSYVVEVAASVDNWYHSYDETRMELQWVDSDASSALLATKSLGLAVGYDDVELVRTAIADDPPYMVFAHGLDSPGIDGVRRSFCGLQSYAEIATTRDGSGSGPLVASAVALAGGGQGPRHQFHIQGLRPGSTYDGILVHTGRKTLGKRQEGEVGGGGRVFGARQVATKTGDNCRLVTGLEFCNTVNYAAPANDNRFNGSKALGQFYDDYAQKMYGFFNNSLAQIACEAPDEAKFSLARNCSSCEVAYKQWLCYVAIPRCEDFTSDIQASQVRNVAQPFPNGTNLTDAVLSQFTDLPARSSRNSMIDDKIAPGPYREILPCEDLCYGLVQSCPAALGFTCPQPGMVGFDGSYGRRAAGDGGGGPSCNSPDGTSVPSGGAHVSVALFGYLAAAAAVVGVFLV